VIVPYQRGARADTVPRPIHPTIGSAGGARADVIDLMDALGIPAPSWPAMTGRPRRLRRHGAVAAPLRRPGVGQRLPQPGHRRRSQPWPGTSTTRCSTAPRPPSATTTMSRSSSTPTGTGSAWPPGTRPTTTSKAGAPPSPHHHPMRWIQVSGVYNRRPWVRPRGALTDSGSPRAIPAASGRSCC
jgi:hypothetical protein